MANHPDPTSPPESLGDTLPTVAPKKVTPAVLAERQRFAEQVRMGENPTPEELKAQQDAQDEMGEAFWKPAPAKS